MARGTILARTFASRTIIEEPFARDLWRKIRHWYWKMEYKTPPYDHVCQVGDPVLRGKAALVDVNSIKSNDIQNLIKKMVKVMRKTGGVGLAAPQIGIGKQVIVLEFTEKHAKVWSEEKFAQREGLLFPLKTFINPKLKILDSREIVLPEGCLSIKGYYANVPRAYKVEVSGYDENAAPVTWVTQGYPARILQHEVDHLNGNLFIDIMDSRTFGDELWQRWNLR